MTLILVDNTQVSLQMELEECQVASQDIVVPINMEKIKLKDLASYMNNQKDKYIFLEGTRKSQYIQGVSGGLLLASQNGVEVVRRKGHVADTSLVILQEQYRCRGYRHCVARCSTEGKLVGSSRCCSIQQMKQKTVCNLGSEHYCAAEIHLKVTWSEPGIVVVEHYGQHGLEHHMLDNIKKSYRVSEYWTKPENEIDKENVRHVSARVKSTIPTSQHESNWAQTIKSTVKIPEVICISSSDDEERDVSTTDLSIRSDSFTKPVQYKETTDLKLLVPEKIETNGTMDVDEPISPSRCRASLLQLKTLIDEESGHVENSVHAITPARNEVQITSLSDETEWVSPCKISHRSENAVDVVPLLYVGDEAVKNNKSQDCSLLGDLWIHDLASEVETSDIARDQVEISSLKTSSLKNEEVLQKATTTPSSEKDLSSTMEMYKENQKNKTDSMISVIEGSCTSHESLVDHLDEIKEYENTKWALHERQIIRESWYDPVPVIESNSMCGVS